MIVHIMFSLFWLLLKVSLIEPHVHAETLFMKHFSTVRTAQLALYCLAVLQSVIIH